MASVVSEPKAFWSFDIQLTRRRARKKITFFPSVFLEAEISSDKNFFRLQSQFETLSASAFWLRYDRQVSTKSEVKNRHRDTSITSPAEGLTEVWASVRGEGVNCLRPKIVSLLDPTLRPLLTMMPNSKRAQIYTVCSSNHDLSFGTLITKIDAV